MKLASCEIEFPPHCQGIPMDHIIMGNILDSCVNILGNVWFVVLMSEKRFHEYLTESRDAMTEGGRKANPPQQMKLPSIIADRADRGVALLRLVAWLDCHAFYVKNIHIL